MTTDKLIALRQAISELGSAVICYSGGLDSALLLTVASKQLGKNCMAFTCQGPWVPEKELERARDYAASIGVEHVVADVRQMGDPSFTKNDKMRCYYCKTRIYEAANDEGSERGFAHVLDGTNTDDLRDYRPGLRAAKEAGVKSPFVQVGMSKDDIRQSAKALGISLWDKPASPCLATRIPYGTTITKQRLMQVQGLEQDLKDLGLSVIRVRHHGDIARLELGNRELAQVLSENGVSLCERMAIAGKARGFRYITIDVEGYRMGSMNDE